MKVDVYWISETPIGCLAIMPRPRSGAWLEDEIQAWRKEGVTMIVSLLTQAEVFELGLQEEAQVCASNEIAFLSFPIPDRQVPASVPATITLIDQIQAWLADNKGIAIHCRMGVGRSALMAACVLQQQGLTTERAFQAIQKARGIKVPDTDEQWQWAAKIAKLLSAGSKGV